MNEDLGGKEDVEERDRQRVTLLVKLLSQGTQSSVAHLVALAEQWDESVEYVASLLPRAHAVLKLFTLTEEDAAMFCQLGLRLTAAKALQSGKHIAAATAFRSLHEIATKKKSGSGFDREGFAELMRKFDAEAGEARAVLEGDVAYYPSDDEGGYDAAPRGPNGEQVVDGALGIVKRKRQADLTLSPPCIKNPTANGNGNGSSLKH